MTERHSLRITVEVKRIRLEVRFPCSLSFKVILDSRQFQCQNSCQLVQGYCDCNEIIQIDTEAVFDKVSSQYENKDMRIIVQMHSSNGTFGAGSIFVSNILKKLNQMVQYVCPLEKCPDRSAQIIFYTSARFKPRSIDTDDRLLTANNKQKSLKYSSSHTAFKTSQVRGKQLQYDSGQQLKNQKSASYLSKKSWNVNQQSHNSQTYLQSNLNRHNQTQGNFFTKQKKQQTTNQLIRKESAEQIQKYFMTQQIQRLKAEVKKLRVDDKKSQLVRVKQQNEAIVAQIDQLKQKVKVFEREQRQYNIQLKQAKQLGEKNKNRFLQAENTRDQKELLLVQKEKTIKQIQGELKKKVQINQDLSVSLTNLQKRLQFRQNAFQQQLKRLNEKYNESQTQRQRLTLQNNNAFNKLEQTQKKYQNMIKQKQKSFNQEKIKFSRSNQQLSQEVNSLRLERKEIQKQLSQITQNYKLQRRKANQYQQKISDLQTKLQSANTQLSKQLQKQAALLAQVKELKVLEQEKGVLRRKNNELNTELMKCKQKIQRLTLEVKNNESKLKQSQRAFAELAKQKDVFQNRTNTIKKQLDGIQTQNQKLIQQYKNHSVYRNKAEKQLSALQERIDHQLKDKKQLKSQYQHQIIYLKQQKQSYQTQLQQIKWAFGSQSSQLKQLSNKAEQNNHEILQLNQTIFTYELKFKKNEEEKNTLQNAVDKMEVFVKEKEQKIQSLSREIKQLKNNTYNLQKQNQSIQSQKIIIKKKMQELEANLQSQNQSNRRHLKQRQRFADQKDSVISQVQLENSFLKQQLSFKQKQIMLKDNQIAALRQSLKNAEFDATSHNIKWMQSKQSLNNTTKQLQSVSDELQKVKKSLQGERKNFLALKSQWEAYQRDTTLALKRFIEQMTRQDEDNTNQQSFVPFPNDSMSQIQASAFKKKKSLTQKHQKIIELLNQQKWALQNSLRTEKFLAEERQKQLQNLLKCQTDREKDSVAARQVSRRQMQNIVCLLEQQILQLTSQNQRRLNEIEKLKQQSEEAGIYITKLQEDKQTLLADLAKQKQAILQYKQKQRQRDSSISHKLSDVNYQNYTKVMGLKNDLDQTTKRLQAESKSSQQKNRIIAKLQLQIAELLQKNQSLQIANLDLEKKLCNIELDKQNDAAKHGFKSEQLDRLKLQLQQIHKKYQEQKIKSREIQEKLSKTQLELAETIADRQHTYSELLVCEELNKDLELNFKNQIEKLKSLTQKYSKQNKQLQQKIIELGSSLDLKLFQIQQKESKMRSVELNLNEIRQQLTNKNKENQNIVQSLEDLQNQNLYNQQSLQMLKSQKESLQLQNTQLKQRVSIIQQELDLAQRQIDVADSTQRQITSLRQQLHLSKLQIDRLNQSNKFSRSRINPKSSNSVGQEERRISQLEQIIFINNSNKEVERQKYINEFTKQKKLLLKENQNLKEQVANLKEQFNFQRLQLNGEIQSLNQQIQRLTQQIEEKHEDHSIYEKLNHPSLNSEFEPIEQKELESSQRLNEIIRQI